MKVSLVCSLGFIIGSALAASATAPVDQLLAQYFLIHKSLATDSINGVSAASVEIAKVCRQSALTAPRAKAQLTALADAASRLQANDLKSARNGFGDLSEKLIAYLQAVGAKRNPPYQFYCFMVKKNWLQPDKETRNPYYGSSMLKCGELIQSVQHVEQQMEHNHH